MSVMFAAKGKLHHNEFDWPVFVQGNYSGVHTVIIDKVAYDKKLRPIQNNTVKLLMSRMPHWTTNFVVQGSWYLPRHNVKKILRNAKADLPVMCRLMLWDILTTAEWRKKKSERQYVQRYEALGSFVTKLIAEPAYAPWVCRVHTWYLGNPHTFGCLYCDLEPGGNDGVVVRSPNGLYTFGKCSDGSLFTYKVGARK